MRLKILNVFRRKNKSDTDRKFGFWRTIDNSSTDFLQDDYFHMMPKTDYTYSRSPSYRRKTPTDKYLIPNMSRKELRDQNLHIDGSDLYISSDDDEVDGGIESDEEVKLKTRTVYEDGILLRSGHSLRSVKSVLEKENRRKSSSSVKHSESYLSEKSVIRRNGVNSRKSFTSSSYGTSSSTVSIGHRSALSSYSSINSIRKDLRERYEDVEIEKGMKEVENQRTKQDTYLPHLDGPDFTDSGEITVSESEEDYTGSSSSGWSSSHKRSSNSNAQEEGNMSSVTTVTTTVITTIFETIVSASSPIVTPVWTTVGKPVWDTVGEPVWRYVGRPVGSVLKKVTYLAIYILSTILSSISSLCKYVFWTPVLKPVYSTMVDITGYMSTTTTKFLSRTVLMDTWILSKRSRSCCFCFPLLLILPFLFYFLTPFIANNLSSRSWSLSLFSAPTAIKIDDLHTINLKEEVRRIIIQLQKRDSQELTESDVERISRDLLKTEIDRLRINLMEGQNQQALQYDQQKQEQNQRLETQNQHLLGKISELEAKLADETKNLKLHGEESGSKSSVLIGKLQDEVLDLKSQLHGLTLSQQTLDLHMKNCCRNDSFYSLITEHKVDQILAQIMSGGGTDNDKQGAFTAWLFSNFINKNDFTSYMDTFAKEITDRILAQVKRDGSTEVFISESDGRGAISEQVVRMIVDDALQKFSADKLGLPDFALESSGGSVINTRCSQTYYKKTAQYSILGIPLWYSSNSPRTVIQPEVQPGSCWAFHGDKGYLVIELSALITPTAITVEHIPKSLSPDGEIKSAPKDMMILGLSDEKDIQGHHLANLTYNENGKPLQYFPIQKKDVGAYRFIELRILNNHGNPTYTCLYRVRVHGIPFKDL